MKKKFGFSLLALILAFICSISATHLPSFAEENSKSASFLHARPSSSGMLSVKDSVLVDQNYSPVVLRGVSLHGLAWFPDFVDNSIFSQISSEWDCNLIRLPVYSEIYSYLDTKKSLNLLYKGIDYAIANDMYVLVDWHILEDNNPNTNIDYALGFFDIVSKKYRDNPNIIYEICNEPSGTTTWNDIHNYSEQIIPVIRNNSPKSVIIVGTPDYDNDLMSPVRRPLNFENIMYSFHFYAATHGEDLQAELIEALNRKLPVFATECGISEANGNGNIDCESASKWYTILQQNGISFTVWNLSNKNESSALLVPTYEPGNKITDDSLTFVGKWVKALLQGQDPNTIPAPSSSHLYNDVLADFAKTLNAKELNLIYSWPQIASKVLKIELFLLLLVFVLNTISHRKHKTYDDHKQTCSSSKAKPLDLLFTIFKFIALLLNMFFALAYIYWRICFSIPINQGIVAIVANLLLLAVELFGLAESAVLYNSLISTKKHPLPEISDDEFPEIDIFITTYNESPTLLKKTINACNHLKYPDKSKVHIWLCDDNHRSKIKKLARSMNVGYFDRPDNKYAKAGNLNNALKQTHSPYVVTIDADMIVKSDFLLKTIPYFVNSEKNGINLGLVQTPQCFYEPDIFQRSLYSEKTAPNEQNFFYRTIECSRTSSNSVIYGGSNAVLSRKALDAVGGFYTETLTEDFATGLLIESAGFTSLAIPEPLASGKTPNSFKEHVKQRTRWGRGVLSSARKLHLFTRRGLSFMQRLNYWSSVAYWYSPIKNLIYILCPLLYAVFKIQVFMCSWVDLMIFWIPMHLMQDLCLRLYSKNTVSLKWSGIYETSIMPFLLKPMILEFFGISSKKFVVTDKSKPKSNHSANKKAKLPFTILIVLSILGFLRCLIAFKGFWSLSAIILLFWLTRNLYFLIMSTFLIDENGTDSQTTCVVDAEPIFINNSEDKDTQFEGITTYMTERRLNFYLDKAEELKVGDKIDVLLNTDIANASLICVITRIAQSKTASYVIYSVDIMDFGESENEYMQILYDRIPSLPQSLSKDYGMINHLLRVFAHRILR